MCQTYQWSSWKTPEAFVWNIVKSTSLANLCMSQVLTFPGVTVPSFPRAVLITSVIGLIFLLVAHFSRWLLFKRSRCSFYKTARPERFPYRVPVVTYHMMQTIKIFGRCEFREWSMLLQSPVPTLCAVSSFVSEEADPSTMSSHLMSLWNSVKRNNFLYCQSYIFIS
jgi:hypothetical protein